VFAIAPNQTRKGIDVNAIKSECFDFLYNLSADYGLSIAKHAGKYSFRFSLTKNGKDFGIFKMEEMGECQNFPGADILSLYLDMVWVMIGHEDRYGYPMELREKGQILMFHDTGPFVKVT